MYSDSAKCYSERKTMKLSRIFNHKLLLNFCNFLFLVCGTLLIFSGFYLFTDSHRILLSRLLAATSDQLNDLPQPLFYYISMAFCFGGLIAVLASIVGCWASCSNTYCLLTLYFLTVVIMLLMESAACIAIILWPQCLGLSFNKFNMVKALQSNYGVPGREQFTIAMDLAQVTFNCCGMNYGEDDYNKSIWRLQSYGQRDWSVPLSCCKLENIWDKSAYLDPQPVNNTLCESLTKNDFEDFRHTSSCSKPLDIWYREQYVFFLGASCIIAVVQFCVLLSIVLSCTKIVSKKKRTQKFIELRSPTKSNQTLVENIYESEIEFPNIAPSKRMMPNASTSMDILTENRKVFVQPSDLNKNRHNTTFKPNSTYQISKSYLV